CVPQAEVFDTRLSETPRFLTEDVDMITLGSCTESNQERILARLRPHAERIRELADRGTVFLLTGNSFEIFGRAIRHPDGSESEGLALFDFTAEQQIADDGILKRFNSLFLGTFGETEIVGYTSRFSHAKGIRAEEALFKVTKGLGSEPGSAFEGVRKNNVFGTYLLGPFLVQNPAFVKYLMGLLGVENPTLAYEDAISKAYDVRLAELKKNILFED
ncbi:MAG: hypothetical protein II738_01370, partial [Clostridia bacterium]|nr:hypothetical protein [Clostridia bacterium]